MVGRVDFYFSRATLICEASGRHWDQNAKMRGRGRRRQQFATLQVQWAGDLLTYLQNLIPVNTWGTTKVWPFTEAHLRKLWAEGLAALHLQRLHLLLAGFHGGGACYQFMLDGKCSSSSALAL